MAHIQNLAHGGLGRALTPSDVAAKLIADGYARMAVGGLMATDKAHILLAQSGIKPPRWQ